MTNWKSVLKGDQTNWLLGKDNPSVRFLALTDILDMPLDSAEVREAKKEIMITGNVPKILSKQKEGGYWEEPGRFYTAKYKGTVWQLIILVELAAEENDERIKNACEFILASCQDAER
ncbi:MAG: hypothetical protein WA915_07765 [Candidatus Aminicenantaceae bacterium]